MLVVKNPSDFAGDIRDSCLIPGLGRFPGGGHGNPLQYSCLENPLDRGAWWLQSIGSQRIGHHWSDLAHTHTPPCFSWQWKHQEKPHYICRHTPSRCFLSGKPNMIRSPWSSITWVSFQNGGWYLTGRFKVWDHPISLRVRERLWLFRFLRTFLPCPFPVPLRIANLHVSLFLPQSLVFVKLEFGCHGI